MWDVFISVELLKKSKSKTTWLWIIFESKSQNIQSPTPVNVKESVKTKESKGKSQKKKRQRDLRGENPQESLFFNFWKMSKCRTRDPKDLTHAKVMINPQPKFNKNKKKTPKTPLNIFVIIVQSYKNADKNTTSTRKKKSEMHILQLLGMSSYWNIHIGIYSSKHLISNFRHILEFGFGRAEDALIVLHLRPTVALIVHLQAVVQQIQILLHFLGLVYWVRV